MPSRFFVSPERACSRKKTEPKIGIVKLPLPSFLALLSVAALFASNQPVLAAEKSKAKPPVIASTDKKGLASKIGKPVAVEGIVHSVGKGDKDGVRFLNLATKPQTGFVAAVFPTAYKSVGPLKNFEGRNVRVTGTLEKYRKQTQIKVLKGSQIKLLPAPKETPAPAKKKK